MRQLPAARFADGGCGASDDSSEVLMQPASPEMKKEAPAEFKTEFIDSNDSSIQRFKDSNERIQGFK